MALAGWIGLNKGLRTVFMALCIPSHVPLNRLPAATGLHLLFAGLFYIAFGPVVGEFLNIWILFRFFLDFFFVTVQLLR